jgi:Cu-processing system ATP-binding protein
MIKIEGLKKRFGKLEVLKGIDLTIETGKITAIVGPNGSGKTTIIKAILGLVKPDGGELTVDGTIVNGDTGYKKLIGYMPQIARFPENLTVEEILDMVKDVRGKTENLEEELFRQFRLEPELKKPIRTLSGGTRQKVSAVIAFLFHPKILILDEPTAGLDPVSSSHLKDKILREKRNGKTFILTSHIMSEIEELADDLVFLQEGHIFYNGRLQTMIQQTGESKLERAIAHLMKGDAA